MPRGPPLQACFYIVFQITNEKLCHRNLTMFDIKISNMVPTVNARLCLRLRYIDQTLDRLRFAPHTFVRLRIRNVS